VIIEDDVFRIEPGTRAEFEISKVYLEKLLDNLPVEANEIHFSMDSHGTVRVQGIVT
jgi:hypothetical protein